MIQTYIAALGITAPASFHHMRCALRRAKERQIAAHALPTKEAVALYNKLAETEAVGGLFVTTC